VCAVACAAFGLWVTVPFQAWADGSDEPPGDTERVITIGPQAVVIQNERGQLRMYDDPAQKVPTCGSSVRCLGQALGAYGLTAFLAFDNLTVVGFDNNRVTPPRLSE
jgi:hypothetical protein